MTRTVMWGLLALVSASAAVLSFDSLRTLATMCGYPSSLSALFPVTVDAGAAAACLTWLDRKSAATSVGRTLTWTLLVASVGMNAVVHYLDAYSMRPAWWLIVGVSAIPPATLGATVHLSVLLGRSVDVSMSESKGQSEIPVRNSGPNFQSETPPSVLPVAPRLAGNPSPAPPNDLLTEEVKPKRVSMTAGSDTLVSKTRELLPIGRIALAKRLDVTEYQARELLKAAKANNGHKVLETSR